MFGGPLGKASVSQNVLALPKKSPTVLYLILKTEHPFLSGFSGELYCRARKCLSIFSLSLSFSHMVRATGNRRMSRAIGTKHPVQLQPPDHIVESQDTSQATPTRRILSVFGGPSLF